MVGVIFAGLSISAASAATDAAPQPETTLFTYPRWVLVDSRGHVYVVDYETNYISEFDGHGSFVRRFGGQGAEPGKLQNPYPARWSHWGSLLIWDYSGVNMFSPDGSFLTRWRPDRTGGWTDRVCDVDRFGRLYVPMREHRAIERFEGNGAPTPVLTQRKLDSVGVWTPAHVWVDRADRLYVQDADRNRHRIVVFSATGQWLTTLRPPEDAPRAFGYVSDVKLTPRDTILVCAGRGILEYDLTGKLRRRFAVPGSPCGLAVDEQGKMYVGARYVPAETSSAQHTAAVVKLSPDGVLLAVIRGVQERKETPAVSPEGAPAQ
jgi:DNA-binding beta-propeller fold protein YncE